MATHRTVYCRSRTPGALIVRMFDGMRQWSHVAGLIDDEYVIEAVATRGGVVITPLTDVIRRSSESIFVDRSVPDKDAGDAWARGTVGGKYDWLGAMGMPWNRDWQHDDRWFCSEHEAAWLSACGLRLFRPGTRGVGPNDVYANNMGIA